MAYSYAALATELTTDPLARGYAAMTDVAAAADLNTAYRPGPNVPADILTVMTWLRSNGLWLPIKAAAAAGTSQGAIAAVDYNSDPRTRTIDFSLAAVQAMIADLVSHSLLTSAQATALAALGTPNITRAVELGWSPAPVAWGDVFRARGS
jgi:hypothetical protein